MGEQGDGLALVAGIAAAAVALGLVAWAMMRFSAKLPIAKFFAYSSGLIAVLAVVLAGKGFAALQESGFVGVSPLAGFPRSPLLGIFPTAQTLGAQAATILLLALGYLVVHRRPAARHRLSDFKPDGLIRRLGNRGRLLGSNLGARAGLAYANSPANEEDGMAGVNKVILVGNLGDDPEVRSLNNGGEVVNMRVATSENWKDRDGNRQERTEWHRVVIFNENLGRVAKSYLKKGSKVYLEGQIQTRKWQDQSGAGPLFDRDRAAALPRRAGAARQPRRRRWRRLRRRRRLWRERRQ